MNCAKCECRRGTLKTGARLGRGMARSNLQRASAVWCLVMAALLTVVQFGGFPHPPLPLYLVFTGVWLFGAAMLWWVPLFGAVGTAVYGVLLGVQIFLMHGGSALNVVISAGSFLATGLAVAFAIERWRARA